MTGDASIVADAPGVKLTRESNRKPSALAALSRAIDNAAVQLSRFVAAVERMATLNLAN
jgi:hypothetical protein